MISADPVQLVMARGSAPGQAMAWGPKLGGGPYGWLITKHIAMTNLLYILLYFVFHKILNKGLVLIKFSLLIIINFHFTVK